MSGIYIPDMEMPTKCPCRLIGSGYDVYCYAVYGIPARAKEYNECCENETKPSWCPILPAADVVEVRHGYWRKTWNVETGAYDAICSNCDRFIIPAADVPIFSYCPLCGARMDERSEDNG